MTPQRPDFKAYFGKDTPILSGAIHYFRVHPTYWRDRLEKLRACGLNTVETYVPWNFHEPKEGEFNFEGFGDLPKFIETAADVGLKVIVRPGPYICAEWEYGGFPAWLNNIPNMRLRCMWAPYLEKVRNYFSVLLPKITPYLLSNGGPVIAMQVENEYGSFGSDKEYLRYTENLIRELGVDCLLFTSDGPTIDMFTGGTVPGVWMTANFGSNPEGNFPMLRMFQPEGPDMCMEFWCGWFDRWGVGHHTRAAEDVADTMERMVKMGASFNFYMFHGGTNFGFWNGANIYDGKYHPTITSYDYCAPLSEAGDMTDTYFACKAALERHFGPAPDIAVANTKKKAYGKVKLDKRISLWEGLGEPVKAASPLTFEELGQGYGYVLYRKQVTLPPLSRGELEKHNYQMPLGITGLSDRAVVFADGKKVGTIYRNNPHEKLNLPMPETGDTFTLDILVENMGRVNYGHGIKYPCGIAGVVTIGHYAVYDWEHYSLPLETLPAIDMLSGVTTTEESPAFYTGTFMVDEACDTFLDFSNFRKGAAFVNGFNLGRYWEIGPMGTLYIPGPLLKVGENEIVLFETDGLTGSADRAGEPEIELKDTPYWVKVN